MDFRGFIATVFQTCQGLFNHADGAFNDLRTPGDNRGRLLRLTDQRCLAAVVERIIVICAGHVPYRRLGLDPYVIHEIVDTELRGSRVDDAPYDHGRDMDGIAVRIVDL